MSTDRTTLCLPIDVALAFDQTVTQNQLSNNTFLGSHDDRDVLSSHIEDAEDEFRQRADLETRVSRVGVPGDRETYEIAEYQLSGHKLYRQRFSHATYDYQNQEETLELANDRVMPFDASAGDEAYIYRGVGEGWEDVTADRGETWDIVDYRSGVVVISPMEIRRAMHRTANGLGTSGRQQSVRMALSYRHGGLGRGRSLIRSTDLGGSLTDTQTGTVAVDDVDVLPSGVAGGALVLKIGAEYLRATLDRDAGEIDVVERGVRGTNAEAHDAGDRVVWVPPSVRKAVASRGAMLLITGERYQDWLPDSEDSIDKSDMMDAFAETWETTVANLGDTLAAE